MSIRYLLTYIDMQTAKEMQTKNVKNEHGMG